MLTIRFIRPVVFILAISSAPSAHSTCPEPKTDSERTSAKLLQELQRLTGVPGLGAAVWAEDKLVWQGCAGLRDIAAQLPVTPDTLFRLASVSKIFAGTAAARLSEQGLLDLEQPVQEILPWLRNEWASINSHQLMAHVSGIGHYTDEDTDNYEALGQTNFASSLEAVRNFSSRPLLSNPGERYEYSSWGFTLLGAVIEAKVGKPFAEWLSAELTPGLRIQADSQGLGKDVSQLYNIDNVEPRLLPPNNLSYTVTGGGLAASPSALASFAGRLMQGKIVNANTWSAMRKAYRLKDGNPSGERDYTVGYAWRNSLDPYGAEITHHSGIVEGGRATLVLWPGEKVAASLMGNSMWVSSIEQTAMALAAPFRTPLRLARAPECPVKASLYRGMLPAKPEMKLSGRVQFELEQGRCIGELIPDQELRWQFSNARGWPKRVLRIVSLSADGSLAQAALVTPYGLYEMRSTESGWQAKIMGQQVLDLKFE